HVGGWFGSAAHIAAQAADEMMDEDKAHRRFAAGERLREPAILRFTERHVPAGGSALRGGPKGVEADEKRVSPLKGEVAVLVVSIGGVRKVGVALFERPIRHLRVA
ncbi:MAG: hypothetical protein ACK55Z_15150, partial [bacterium]